MSNQAQPTILVTGGSGQLARLVLDGLLARGVAPDKLIATTRSPEKLADLAARGIAVRKADFKDPSSLESAFAGAEKLLVTSIVPDLPYVSGQRFIQQRAAIEAGVRAGAKHIFYTSYTQPEPPNPIWWTQDHHDTELALRQSGAAWTIIRDWEWPEWYYYTEWLSAAETGQYHSASGSGRVSYVVREDCARAIVGALLAHDSQSRVYSLTGPEALTGQDIAAAIGEAFEREVALIPCTPAELGRRLEQNGLPEILIPFSVRFAEGVALGRYDGLTNHVEMLSGRKPMTIRDYMRTERAARPDATLSSFLRRQMEGG
ncbi:MAG TPA: NAD(P)H-binding protein [Allosphingosinicella sp.]|nr:NAD(P)H-binding protein [Allosphingosinicella sp.]